MSDGTDAGSNQPPLPGPTPPGVPVPPSIVPRMPPPPSGSDSRAQQEEDAIDDGRDLEREAREGDHDRIEKLRKHFYCISMLLMWLAAGLLALGLLEWSAHILLPDAWSFLKPAQLQTIQHLLTTVAVSGLVGGFARRVMKNPNDKSSDH